MNNYNAFMACVFTDRQSRKLTRNRFRFIEKSSKRNYGTCTIVYIPVVYSSNATPVGLISIAEVHVVRGLNHSRGHVRPAAPTIEVLHAACKDETRRQKSRAHSSGGVFFCYVVRVVDRRSPVHDLL